MKVQINITKEVLQKSMYCPYGDPKCGTNCAFALAVRDLLPDALVNECYIDVGIHIIDLPQAAQTFIFNFDQLSRKPEERLLLPELSIEIDLPAELINEIGIEEVHKILSESKTMQLV